MYSYSVTYMPMVIESRDWTLEVFILVMVHTAMCASRGSAFILRTDDSRGEVNRKGRAAKGSLA